MDGKNFSGRCATLLTLAFMIAVPTAWAQTATNVLRFDKSLREDDAQRGKIVRLCFYRPAERQCWFTDSFGATMGNGSIVLSLDTICKRVLQEPVVVNELDVAAMQQPGKILYRIDCRHPFQVVAKDLRSQTTRHQTPPHQPPPRRQGGAGGSGSPGSYRPPPTSPAAPIEPGSELDREILQVLTDVEARLQRLERSSATPPPPTRMEDLRTLTDAQTRLERRVDDFEKKLLARLDSLGGQEPAECTRVGGRYDGVDEVTVHVRGTTLRFLKVPAAHDIAIGLSEETATKLYNQALREAGQSVLPSIFRSVPEVRNSVPSFYIQERLVEPALYAELVGGGTDARQVSYREVGTFIKRLNGICEGQAKFDLPSEEQFVAAAHNIYNPMSNYDPKKGPVAGCNNVRWKNLMQDSSTQRISQLLGHYWQLTRSPCRPFEGAEKVHCEEGTWIRKGGSRQSQSALECLPEFRGAASDNVPLTNTSFRLVLVE